jgi:ribA/ribD-fused uncharacterized protein
MASSPIRFFGTTCEFGCFSNMFPAKFTINKISYPTNEHFFQAKKFETTDPAYFNVVRNAATPKSAKALGKSRKHPIRQDWNTARLDVMEEGLRGKFSQNEQLKEKLLATGERELQESAPRDNFWGTGSKGNGQNMLGKLLMKVRKEMAEEVQAQKKNKKAKKEADEKNEVSASRAGKKSEN